MTEEEIKVLAREYIDSCTTRAGFVILPEGIKSDFIDLFVAGFMKCFEQKATNPKWHKVADGDLPPEDTDVLALLADKEIYMAHFYRRNVWDKIGPVIAWCEIPQYTGE